MPEVYAGDVYEPHFHELRLPKSQGKLISCINEIRQQNNYRPTAAVVLHDDSPSKNVVMVRTTEDSDNGWEPIHGSIDSGELLEEAAAREVHDALGISLHHYEKSASLSAIILKPYQPWREKLADEISEHKRGRAVFVVRAAFKAVELSRLFDSIEINRKKVDAVKKMPVDAALVLASRETDAYSYTTRRNEHALFFRSILLTS